MGSDQSPAKDNGRASEGTDIGALDTVNSPGNCRRGEIYGGWIRQATRERNTLTYAVNPSIATRKNTLYADMRVILWDTTMAKEHKLNSM
ncbi:unnamed protein product [Lasius platythorax]|uniref:Uncharacterized protein n=1 Tax=Lasius platythorax TaxID=488582 RepID=A0AAV2NBV3_9HYME